MKIMPWLSGLLIFNHGIGQTIKPGNLNDGIKTATLSEVGMDTSIVYELTSQITKFISNA
jgi:hypothetical protein